MPKITNNTELLDLLQEDSNKSTGLWQPTSYWKPYCRRICSEIKKSGLDNFRVNQLILKGYGSGGPIMPVKSNTPWKRFIWESIEKLPLFNRSIDRYKKIIRVYHRQYLQNEEKIARLVLDNIAEKFPDFVIPTGIENGGAEDSFEWRGNTVCSAWVRHLSRIADFYAQVAPETVKTIAEIGPGVGFSSIAHKALNPHLKTIINVDIVPTIYVSGQYLDSIDGIHVVTYDQTKEMDVINVQSDAANTNDLTIFSLPPWEFDKVTGSIDFFFNAYSFQEMEKEICENYSRIIMNLVEKGVLLHSHVKGHKPNAGGQKEPIYLSFLEDLFRQKYPSVQKIDGIWPAYYDGDVEEIRLMHKKAA